MAERSDPPPTTRIKLGRIVGIHGLRGWLKLISYTEPRDQIFDYSPLLIDGRVEPRFEGKQHGKGLLIRFPGREDRSSVEELLDAEIEVERGQLPSLEEGEYYWADLEGLAVRNQQGAHLGEVRRLIGTGANDVLEVKGETVILIPFVHGMYVLDIDMDAREILVDWSEDWS